MALNIRQWPVRTNSGELDHESIGVETRHTQRGTLHHRCPKPGRRRTGDGARFSGIGPARQRWLEGGRLDHDARCRSNLPPFAPPEMEWKEENQCNAPE